MPCGYQRNDCYILLVFIFPTAAKCFAVNILPFETLWIYPLSSRSNAEFLTWH